MNLKLKRLRDMAVLLWGADQISNQSLGLKCYALKNLRPNSKMDSCFFNLTLQKSAPTT